MNRGRQLRAWNYALRYPRGSPLPLTAIVGPGSARSFARDAPSRGSCRSHPRVVGWALPGTLSQRCTSCDVHAAAAATRIGPDRGARDRATRRGDILAASAADLVSEHAADRSRR